MTTEGVALRDGGNVVAAGNYTNNQFYAVKATTTPRTVTLASTGGEAIYGILQNAPNTGEAADVCICGLTKAIAGAAGFTAGDALMTESGTGKLVTQTSTNVKVARALETAAAGVLGLVFVAPLTV